MTSSSFLCDLVKICRKDTKWGPDLVSQALHAPLPLNFIYDLLGNKMTLVQFEDQVQNEDQSWYHKFHIHQYLQIFLDMMGWQQNFISEIFIVVTWLWYNLKTLWKMRTKHSISGSANTNAFKLVRYVGRIK